MGKQTSEVVELVIEKAGGGAVVAEALGVTPQAVSDWKANKRIPGGRVIALERLTKGEVTRHQMRPDLYPESGT